MKTSFLLAAILFFSTLSARADEIRKAIWELGSRTNTLGVTLPGLKKRVISVTGRRFDNLGPMDQSVEFYSFYMDTSRYGMTVSFGVVPTESDSVFVIPYEDQTFFRRSVLDIPNVLRAKVVAEAFDQAKAIVAKTPGASLSYVTAGHELKGSLSNSNREVKLIEDLLGAKGVQRLILENGYPTDHPVAFRIQIPNKTQKQMADILQSFLVESLKPTEKVIHAELCLKTYG